MYKNRIIFKLKVGKMEQKTTLTVLLKPISLCQNQFIFAESKYQITTSIKD
jgi:hypothetical protein